MLLRGYEHGETFHVATWILAHIQHLTYLRASAEQCKHTTHHLHLIPVPNVATGGAVVPGDGLGGAAAAGTQGVQPQSRHRCGRGRGAHPRRPRARRQPQAGLVAAAGAAAGAAGLPAPRRRCHVRDLVLLTAHNIWPLQISRWHGVRHGGSSCFRSAGSGLSRRPPRRCGCCR